MGLLGAEGEGFGLGTLLAGAASALFVAFIGYKIAERREELRNTVELMTDDHAGFVQRLEAMIETGSLSPVSGA